MSNARIMLESLTPTGQEVDLNSSSSSTAAKKNPKIILFARGLGEYTETLTNIELLSPLYRTVVVSDFPLNSDGRKKLAEKATSLGATCYDISISGTAVDNRKERESGIRRKLKKLNRYDTFKKFYQQFVSQHKVLASKERSFIDIIEREKPSAFIINNVNGGTGSEIYIRVCRKRKIPTILVPFTYVSPIAPARAYMDNPDYHVSGFKKAIMKIFFRRWLYTVSDTGLTLSRLPCWTILLHRFMRIETPLPWVQDSSTVDVIAAESEHLLEHYVRLGIPGSQICLTGKPNMDYLAELRSRKREIRQDVLGELSFPRNGKVLLLAIPPSLPLFDRPQYDTEFTSHRDVVELWVEQVKKLRDFNIIICLHPSLKCDDDFMAYITEMTDEKVKVSLRDTAELLVVSDLYVAASSGTILWSLALGTPVVDHDVYGFNYGFFADNDDVCSISTQEEFVALTKSLNDDPFYLDKWRRQVLKNRTRYGILDGKSVERLQELIKKKMS